jgi:5-methylthioadenosine/S-adenosylhomocysteine deaminase
MRYILTGRVVTMDAARTILPNGAVYVDGNTISSVCDSAAPAPAGFEAATKVVTNGVILPGLIELHNHLSYNALQLWSVPKRFNDRGQWQRHPQYVQLVNGPMLKLAQSTDPRVLAAIARFAETKCLLGGVTSSQGISLKSDRLQRYYRGAMRVVEDPTDSTFLKAATHIPDLGAKDWNGFNKELQKAHCLLLHLSEGFDDSAFKAFKALQNQETGAWAISGSLAGIHCAALGEPEFAVMKAHQGSMIWSPLSNLMLYGQTAQVGIARQQGVPIALGSDWSPSGSKNLIHELKVAKVANEIMGYGFSDADIVGLATSTPASILKWSPAVGSIEPGKRADITVISAPAASDAYSAIISADETDVLLVVIDGQATVGTPALMIALGTEGETLMVGGQPRVINYGTPDPEIVPITYAEAIQVLEDALAHLPNVPTATPQVLNALGPQTKRHWSLALDEQHDTGFALRPMLEFNGSHTGPDVNRLALKEIAAAPIGPVPLDKVCVPNDPEYFDKLAGQMNIPQDIKDGLRSHYPT